MIEFRRNNSLATAVMLAFSSLPSINAAERDSSPPTHNPETVVAQEPRLRDVVELLPPGEGWENKHQHYRVVMGWLPMFEGLLTQVPPESDSAKLLEAVVSNIRIAVSLKKQGEISALGKKTVHELEQLQKTPEGHILRLDPIIADFRKSMIFTPKPPQRAPGLEPLPADFRFSAPVQPRLPRPPLPWEAKP